MRITAPEQPIITPSTFLLVIGSLRIRAARIIEKMGIEVVTIDELMGDVILSPMV